MTNVLVDLGDEIFDTLEGSSSDGSLRNNIEPDFDLIEP